MTRAHRLAAYASGFVILYFLALFAIVPIPLIDANIAEQILPIVCILLSPSVGQLYSLMLDPVVASRFFRLLLTLEPRLGPFHIQRLPGGIS